MHQAKKSVSYLRRGFVRDVVVAAPVETCETPSPTNHEVSERAMVIYSRFPRTPSIPVFVPRPARNVNANRH